MLQDPLVDRLQQAVQTPSQPPMNVIYFANERRIWSPVEDKSFMHTIVLDNIPFRIEIDPLADKLRIDPKTRHLDDLQCLIDEAQGIGKPKAHYKTAYIDSKGENHVIVEGTRLTSRVLRVNLEHAHRVFPYVATCGTELQDWATSFDDMLQRYWAEVIQEQALRTAMKALTDHLSLHHHPGNTSTMSPGRLEAWPMEEQSSLFALLGDTEGSIGVRLTDSLLMVPTKSVSGIRFPTEESFESCQLCPRERCPGRKAPYDEDLYDRRYRQ